MTQLQRNIGLLSLTLYGVGDILGSGIYGLVGKAAGQMGNLVWLAFLTSFFVALMTGLCYAALSARYARAAGSSFIIWKAFRSPFVAFVAGLATLASGLTSMATAANVFSGYFAALVAVPSWCALLGFALLLAGIVLSGIKQSIWVNTICTLIEATGLLLIIISGLPYLGSVDLLDTHSIPVTETLSPTLVFSGAVLTFYSFIGFEDMLNVSEEVVNPKRTVPLALLFAMLIASGIYMLISVIAVSVIPAAELSASGEPLVAVIRKAWPWFPTQVFSVIALFAVGNTALLNFIMASRLTYGLGHLGLLPNILSRVHGRTKTPAIAIAAVLAVFLILAFVGNVSSLARATSLCLLLVYLGMNSSLFLFQYRERHQKKLESWRIPQIIPVLGIAGTLVMMANAQSADFAIAGSLLAAIVVLYFVRRPTAAQIEQLETAENA